MCSAPTASNKIPPTVQPRTPLNAVRDGVDATTAATDMPVTDVRWSSIAWESSAASVRSRPRMRIR